MTNTERTVDEVVGDAHIQTIRKFAKEYGCSTVQADILAGIAWDAITAERQRAEAEKAELVRENN